MVETLCVSLIRFEINYFKTLKRIFDLFVPCGFICDLYQIQPPHVPFIKLSNSLPTRLNYVFVIGISNMKQKDEYSYTLYSCNVCV